MQKVAIKEMHFPPSHMKLKSKINYQGKNSILHKQMAEQLAVEVDVKNVTDRRKTDIYLVWI